MQEWFSGSTKRLISYAALAALLYSSWPLGYLLNPSGNRGLASNLEGIGQPYNWLFIALDIIAGIIISIVAVAFLQPGLHKSHALVRNAIVSYGLFGAMTALDALLPVDCAADQNGCGIILNHPLVIVHGIASLASIGFMTLSIAFIWLYMMRVGRPTLRIRLTIHAMLATLVLFGCITAVLIAANRTSATSQHVFITVCSIWIVLLPNLILSEKLTLITVKKSRRRRAQVVKTL